MKTPTCGSSQMKDVKHFALMILSSLMLLIELISNHFLLLWKGYNGIVKRIAVTLGLNIDAELLNVRIHSILRLKESMDMREKSRTGY